MKKKDRESTPPVACTILTTEEVLSGAVFDSCGCTVEVHQHRVMVTDKIGTKFRFYAGGRFALMDGLVYTGDELAQLGEQVKAQAGE